MKRKLLSLLMLLMAVSGTWADVALQPGDTWDEDTKTLTVNHDPGSNYSSRSEIEHLVIGNGVTSIGDNAFKECYRLTSVTFGSGVESIGDNAFKECYELTSVTIGSNVRSIGNDAFNECINLTSVIFASESRLESIGNFAFYKCSSMTSIDIPADVTSIGEGAFSCTGLTSITIPAYVTSIGNFAFVGCSSLATITVDGANTTYDSRNNCNAIIKKSSNELVAGCKNTTIPASVTSIVAAAFEGCTGLTSIIIPASVTSIGEFAFENCTNLATVRLLPTTPPTRGNHAFAKNKAGRKIYVPSSAVDTYKNNTEWSYYANDIEAIIASGTCGASGHKSDVMWFLTGTSPNFTLSIMKVGSTGAMADYNNQSSRPWYDCRSSITSIAIEDGVTTIGINSFAECANVSTVTIGNNVTSIGSDAFKQSGLTAIIIPASVTSIGNWAFENCIGLTSVAIGKGVTSIGSYAFSGCSNLTTITVDGENSTYDSRNDCNAIIDKDLNTLVVGCKGTTIPNTVTSIGNQAFQGSGLTSITIPSNVTSIGRHAFDGCSSLATVSGCEGVTSVGSFAFNNTAWLTAQPNGVIYINTVAYLGKNVSGEISMEPGTVSISPYAFDACTGLTAITIPASVTSIGECAFRNCTGLTSITIPASVLSIDYATFRNCTGLTSVTVYASSCTLGNYAFDNCASGLKIYMFSDLVGTYQGAADWSTYASKIMAMTNPNGSCGAEDHESDVRWVLTGESPNYTLTIMKVGETGAMADYTGSRPWESYCSQITSVVVEDGVTSIGNFAFVECTNVSTVTIGNNVTSIGNWAFKECVGLTSVAIGKGVSSIGDEAFSGCINLATITVDGENSTYDSRNSCNAIIETTSNKLVVGCKGTTIPNTVTSIGKQAFQGSGLTSITIPSNVTSIGKFAFDGCSSLATVSGCEGVTSVGSYAFNNTAWLTAQPDGVIYINKVAYLGKNVSGEISINPGTESISPYAFFMKTGLTAITIPASVTSIGDFAFYQCTGLTSITIPAGVTSIGFGAFYECSSLASVTVYASTPPTLDTYTFWDCANLAKIYVPAASLETYKAADNWKDYASKIEGLYTVTFGGSLPDGVTGVATPNIVAAGETVALSFSDTPTGYTFGGYTAKDAADNDITATAISGSTLTMPASDVTVSVSFKKLLTNTDITIAEIADQTYTGSEIKPAITVKDGTTDITDQCDITYTNNTNVGTATVTIKAKASSTTYAGETEASFKIILTGDINGDKVVNVADIVKAISDGKSQEDIDDIVDIIMNK